MMGWEDYVVDFSLGLNIAMLCVNIWWTNRNWRFHRMNRIERKIEDERRRRTIIEQEIERLREQAPETARGEDC